MSQETKVDYLKEKLENFLNVLDKMDPETTELEDIDRLISMMDELEDRIKEL